MCLYTIYNFSMLLKYAKSAYQRQTMRKVQIILNGSSCHLCENCYLGHCRLSHLSARGAVKCCNE